MRESGRGIFYEDAVTMSLKITRKTTRMSMKIAGTTTEMSTEYEAITAPRCSVGFPK